MIATVKCKCGESHQVETDDHLIAGALLTDHAAQPHSSHGIGVEIDPGIADHDLTVECIKCPGIRDDIERVPAALVPAYLIAFHTAHEGHRMRWSWGGFEYESPLSEGASRRNIRRKGSG